MDQENMMASQKLKNIGQYEGDINLKAKATIIYCLL